MVVHMNNLPRPEYPRPQFVRDLWLNLNGEWDFQLDKADEGMSKKWFEKPNFFEKIQVPFAYQSKLSQVECKDPSDWCWYYRKFIVPSKMTGKQIVLHFGAVDYQTWVYVNGKMVGFHEGGHTSFSFDITPYLVSENEQSLTIRVYDPLKDETIPRGKQFWEEKSAGIWYTPTTGIWQTVWLEAVEKTHIKNVRFTSDIDKGTVVVEANVTGDYEDAKFEIEIAYKGQQIIKNTFLVSEPYVRLEFDLYNKKIFRSGFHGGGMVWSPESPNLFDVTMQLATKITVDKVESYFGLRKIHTENGKVFLNNRPYYQKLVLDQGYWPGGLLTAPTDEDLKKDIVLSKEMGFNGCRKHQKVEDPRFLYWADKLGYLVWGECAASPCFSEEAAARLTKEWIEIIERDYNHPSIVTWVPINESWGVPNVNISKQEQHCTLAMYYLIKSLDPTRLVVSNDGWEMTKTDILAVHNYNHGHKDEVAKYNFYKETLSTQENLVKSMAAARNLYAQGYEYQGEPILLTEYGGIAYKVDGSAGWGYTIVENEDQLLEDYARIMEAIFASKSLHGFCYTQLTDVEQEINGLLSYDRKPKCDLAKIRELNNHPR